MQEGGSWGVPGMDPVQEGGGFLCRKGVPRGFLRQFMCRKGGGFLSDMHMLAHTRCPIEALQRPSPCIATAADPWHAVRTVYLPHCIVNPSNQMPCESKGTECQPAGMHTKRPAPMPPWCSERSPRRPSTSSGPRVWARVVPSPSGTPKRHCSPRPPGRILQSGRSPPPECSQAA